MLKTIEKAITSKLEDWISNIEDKSLATQLELNIIVAGGAITSLAENTPVHDYDVYLTDEKLAVKLINYYRRKLHPEDKDVHYADLAVLKKSLPNGRVEAKGEYSPTFVTENSITLTNKIQIITRYIGSPAYILSNFDFQHTLAYWFRGKIKLPAATLLALIRKELVYVNSKYPIASLFRVLKFTERGYSISREEMLKIILHISTLDLKNPEVLEDQLKGVYIGGVSKALETLQKYKKENPKMSIGASYLLKILEHGSK